MSLFPTTGHNIVLTPGRYEATKLMMLLLENHEDQTLQRMAVAVVSILVAKVSLIHQCSGPIFKYALFLQLDTWYFRVINSLSLLQSLLLLLL